VAAGTHTRSEAVKAPGLGAFVRRHPKLGQRAAIGAIGAGVALFAVAAATTAAAVPNLAAPPALPTTTAYPLPVVAPPPAPSSATPSTAAQVTHRDVKQTAKQAPVSHGVISGLAANGIPQVALNAYRVAAARLADVDPGCGIGWWLLAGIGRVESDHGRFAGAVLHADGVSTPRIIGIPLDGSRSEAILDTDGGSLDTDPVYDHAVGPMQFIPSTWAIYGTDATGDGKADVFNINDAALSAARYLCAAGGDLHGQAGQVRAVLAYNHSVEYLGQVLALADAYRRGIPVSGIPVGITSGDLPAITDTGYIPPANPGAPQAGKPGKDDGAPSRPAGSGEPHGSTSSPHPSSSSPKPTSPKPDPSSPKPTPTKPKPTPTSSEPTPTPTSTCSRFKALLHLC
jgi:membrane-bound lytic murein transglycosylase B